MSSSLPGKRELPESQYDLSTYWGRVRHAAGITDPRYGGHSTSCLSHFSLHSLSRWPGAT